MEPTIHQQNGKHLGYYCDKVQTNRIRRLEAFELIQIFCQIADYEWVERRPLDF